MLCSSKFFYLFVLTILTLCSSCVAEKEQLKKELSRQLTSLPSTHPAPKIVVPKGQREYIFQDKMQPGWELNSWKWGNTNASISTAYKYQGTSSIYAEFAASWSGVSFDSLNANGNVNLIVANKFEAITFAISLGDTPRSVLQHMQLILMDSNGQRQSFAIYIEDYLNYSSTVNNWYQVTIPMEDLVQDEMAFNQIVFFNNSGVSTHFSFYLDDVALVKDNSLVSTPAPLPAPVPAPTLAPAPIPVQRAQVVTTPTGGVAFRINSQNNRRPISPYIYGVNDTVASRLRGTAPYPHATFYRLGGNRTTTYNWENNASNAGMDWGPNISDSYLSSSSTPGKTVTQFISRAMSKSAASMVTVPMVPFVAANKNNRPLRTNAANDLGNWKINQAFKPQFASSLVADTSDDYVYQEEFVSYVEDSFARSRSLSKALFYSLDNEPGIWSETHPLVYPAKVTYADLLSRSIEYANMIKQNSSAQALVFGGVAYGYNEFVSLQNAPDSIIHGDWFDYFLSSMRQAERDYGKRLLDVLDIHFYSENRSRDGVGINGRTNASQSQAIIDARVQAPRSLWDASFVENSWIAKDYLNGAVNLLPSLQHKIDTLYPGTKLSISEYSYGGENHISGTIAQADALGIFGREGVFAANYYELNEGRYPYAAFDLYRNYDGIGNSVGDISIAASTTDINASSIYAFSKSGDDSIIFLVAINKSAIDLPANIGITHSSLLTDCAVYQVSEQNPIPFIVARPIVKNNVLSYRLPAYSVSTFILRR